MAFGSIPELVELALALFALGALAGLLVGLFGAYGGLAIVPVLHPLLTTLDMHNSLVVHLAAGISLALVGITGACVWRERRLHRGALVVDRAGWLWLISAAAVAASVVVSALPSGEMEMVFTVAVLIGAVKMLVPHAPLELASAPAGAGLAAGGYAAMMPVEGLSAFMREIGDLGRSARRRWQDVVSFATNPLGVCAVLAIPSLFGLALTSFGGGALSPASPAVLPVLCIGIILATAVLLAPLGAELSRQFPKRVLDVSLGLFLLMLAGQFAFTLLMS